MILHDLTLLVMDAGVVTWKKKMQLPDLLSLELPKLPLFFLIYAERIKGRRNGNLEEYKICHLCKKNT
jgi:hypothetical protein